MKKNIKLILRLTISIVIVSYLAYLHFKPVIIRPCDFAHVERNANINPDNSNTVIPPNIAPLNFIIDEPAKKYYVEIYAEKNQNKIAITSNSPKIKIPHEKWARLLNKNKGKKIYFDIYTKENTKKTWTKFKTIENTVAEEEIDRYVVYRKMEALYTKHQAIGIYQRDLTNFSEKPIVRGKGFRRPFDTSSGGCVNCHCFCNNSPDKMVIAFRDSKFGFDELIAIDGKIKKIGTKFGYPTWHPTGQMITYSINKVFQFFHSKRNEVRDVVDLDSALSYYDLKSQKVKTSSQFSSKEKLETFPNFSPDGKYLYYCCATTDLKGNDQQRFDWLKENHKKIRYDLMRISYDIKTDTWGQAETVLSSKETNKSILLPRISPDGKFIIFCMCDYSSFSLYLKDSDLYIANLDQFNQTGKLKYSRLTCNSNWPESWHCWSSNNRWLVFSSKRFEGRLFTKLYICHIDENGNSSKPILLPQQDPSFYDSFIGFYGLAELIKKPVNISEKEIIAAVRSSEKINIDMPLTGATFKAKLDYAPNNTQQTRE